MSVSLKDIICASAHCVLECEIYKKIMLSYYDNLISIDLDEIIKKYNNGDYSVLDNQRVDWFMKLSSEMETNLISLIKELCAAMTLHKYKALINMTIHFYKRKGNYNERKILYENLTCGDIIKALDIAEDIINNRKVYEVLSYLLRNRNLYGQIKERKCFFAYVKDNPDDMSKFLEAIRDKKVELRCIRMDYSRYSRKDVGTEAEIALSELIDSPFLKDGLYFQGMTDLEEYIEGNFIVQYRIKKSFVEEPSSDEEEIIRKEQFVRNRMEFDSDSDEAGFILKDNFGIQITRRELINLGINPDRIGWRPIRIERRFKNPANEFKLFGANCIDAGKCLVKMAKL